MRREEREIRTRNFFSFFLSPFVPPRLAFSSRFASLRLAPRPAQFLMGRKSRPTSAVSFESYLYKTIQLANLFCLTMEQLAFRTNEILSLQNYLI
jgi:hypothetical protein